MRPTAVVVSTRRAPGHAVPARLPFCLIPGLRRRHASVIAVARDLEDGFPRPVCHAIASMPTAAPPRRLRRPVDDAGRLRH
jgi:hypothetical protein